MIKVHTNETLLEALRTAAKELGEPLSTVAYQKAAKSLGLPAHLTIIVRFGSWQEACRLAGVRYNPGRGKQSGSTTKTDCYEAMRECRKELGKQPTYIYYTHWARRNGKPSGPTVRVKCGDWKTAAKEAFR